MRNAFFIFLLFDRMNPCTSSVSAHKEYLPINADDPSQDQDARWAQLRMQFNSPTTHLEKIKVIYDDYDKVSTEVYRVMTTALQGVAAAKNARRNALQEKTNPTYEGEKR